MFDINKLTLGEVAAVEDKSGQAISQISDDTAPKGKLLAALAWVAKRRENINFKWDEALNLTFDEATVLLGLGDDEAADEASGEEVADPTQAALPTD